MPRNFLKYPVEIVEDVFGESKVLAKTLGEADVLIVADMNVVQRMPGLGVKIGKYASENGISLAGPPVVMGGGEKIKLGDFRPMRSVLDAAIAAGLGPDDRILAIGGGTVIDVAGYAAAQVRGGVGVVRLPTTPAAMLGTAFADVAALDAPDEKDAFVLPCEPKAVIIDTSFAGTVLDGVWNGGMAEAVRLGVAKDGALLKTIASLVDRFASRDGAVLRELVEATLATRRKKGSTDLGLAVAASLEPKSAWKLPHGYAVAIGILADISAAIKAGDPREDDLALCRDILDRCGALDGLRHSRHILPPELADF